MEFEKGIKNFCKMVADDEELSRSGIECLKNLLTSGEKREISDGLKILLRCNELAGKSNNDESTDQESLMDKM